MTYFAATGWTNDGTVINTGDPDIYHYHINQWYMHINVSLFYEHDAITHTPSIYSVPSTSKDNVSIVRNRTGEHEIGHVLGLYDVDECCSASTIQHHEELLMGYGFMSGRSQDVSYKDISGVAITRGFHSNNDHRWMKRVNVDGTIDMICSICNGVRKNVTLDSGGETYERKAFVDYQDCRHHGHSNSNMLLVAVDGMRKFYKCMYCRHIITVENSYNIGNYSSEINISTNIKYRNNSSVFFELNSQYNKKYEIIANATNTIDLKLYDEYFNLISTLDINASSQIEHIINSLNIGKYYLEVENLSTTNIDLSIIILSRTSAYLSYNTQNNILLNTYNGIHDYYYINDQGPGFYKFKLTGTNIDGTTFTYPDNAIKIYNETPKTSTNLLEKYSLTGYANHAQNKYNEDSFIVCLPRNGYFYLDINVPSTNLASLTIEVLPLYNEEIDLFELSESNNSYLPIMSSSIKGDYFEALELNQTGKFVINATYDGSQTDDILFVLAERAYNTSTNSYYINPISVYLMDAYYNSYSITRTLTEGTYYIGYFNKDDTSNFSVSLTRLVTQSGASALLVDPGSDWDCGSQINIIEMYSSNKSYNSTNITEGFTRIIYMNEPLGLSGSRLDYYWYSSNEFIATVTNYGTVLGRNAGTVKIMAISKEDPSKVFVKQFTIIEDDGTGYTPVESNYIIKYSDTDNGTFHLELEDVLCPYPWYQYYSWSTYVPCQYEEPLVTNDIWGNYTVSGPGTFDLIGQFYIYNTVNITVVVIIHFIVTDN